MPGTCLSDPEEREAVILFADIVDSTAMAEELSLRAYGKVIWELQQIAEHVGSGFSKVCACPGSIASTRGDEICLTFHSQPGQTAQLQRNVQLALQSAVNLKLMWLVSDYNRERIKQDHLPRDLAIGVHLGQILHGRFPATAPRKSSEGFAFSVAKRIESAARAGRVSRVYLSDPIVHPLRQQCKDLQWDMPALSARGPLDQAKGLPAGRYNVHELDGIGDVPFSSADSRLGLEIDPTIFAICERIGLAHPNERWLCWLVAMLCRQQAGQTRWSDPPNHDLSAQWYCHATEVFPTWWRLWNDWGELYMLGPNRDLVEALRKLRQAVACAPDALVPRHNLINALLFANKPEAAAEEVRKVRDQLPRCRMDDLSSPLPWLPNEWDHKHFADLVKESWSDSAPDSLT